MSQPPISGPSPLDALRLQQLRQEAKAETLHQVESEANFEQWANLDTFNPLVMAMRFRALQEQKGAEEQVAEQAQAEEEAGAELPPVTKADKPDQISMRFQQRNEELQSRSLLILRARITSKDSPEEIIKKVLEAYSDVSLADEAFEFLEQSCDPSMAELLQQAHVTFRKRYQRGIKAGRNMGAEARKFSQEGLGSPNALRDLYRDITGTPREPIKLFAELSDKYPYEKLQTTIHFLLHSLGADLRSKGPSISSVELKRLIDEIFSLQGVMGIYRFFKDRMISIKRQFSSRGMQMPQTINFEVLAKQFVHFLADRFLSAEKIKLSEQRLGVAGNPVPAIIIFSQMRDAIKQVSTKFYRNQKHRDEILAALFKVLEELEDQLEE